MPKDTQNISLKTYDFGVDDEENMTDVTRELFGSTVSNMTKIDDAIGEIKQQAITDKTSNQVALDGKVDKVAGKKLSTEDYTSLEKTKLTGIENNANNYTHPLKHDADIITDNASKRFASDVEKGKWNTVLDKADKTYVDTELGKKSTKIEVNAHTSDISNPHSVTKTQVGLENANNTSDLAKPVSTATQTALNLKADKTQVLTDVPANAKFTDTVYTHPTTAGNKHIPTGGEIGQILKNTDNGTATWQTESVTLIQNNLTTTTEGSALDSTQGKILNDRVTDVKIELRYAELSSLATNIDESGTYQGVEWHRLDSTLYARSTLIGVHPHNQVKVDYYNNDGDEIIKSITWEFDYDENGFIYKRTVV